ncbi:MAG: hypothetical protein DDG60_09600 [Anaerolineae bacterium]|nr:MAG: hypothetical protein DDG60_09600 [Anaerolineae bacterium]
MANLSWGRRLFLTTLGGLAGLFIVYLAMAIALGAAVQAMSIFSPGSFSSWGTLIFFGLAPALIIFGAAITAWALGARLWRGLLAGVVTLGAFAFFEVGQANYSPLNVRETLAFVGGALATVLVSTVGRGEQRAWILAAGLILMLALALSGLRLILPGKESGLVISILAWIILPLAATFFTMPRQNR